ncbi:MAG: hypothetical protein ACXAC5_03035 [Promethearchaeota archaeon]|jgi:hypothetical protein
MIRRATQLMLIAIPVAIVGAVINAIGAPNNVVCLLMVLTAVAACLIGRR